MEISIDEKLQNQFDFILLEIERSRKLHRGITDINIDKWDIITALFIATITLISLFGIAYASSYIILSITGKSAITLGFVINEIKDNQQAILKMTALLSKMDWLTASNLKNGISDMHYKTKDFLMESFDSFETFISYLNGN